MSDEREYDAAVIAKYRASLDLDFTWDGWTNPERLALDTRDAALREIDRLTAERDAARAEVKQLRAVLGGVPEVLESYAESVQPHLDNTPNPTAGLALAVIRAKAAAIRAALESEADHD